MILDTGKRDILGDRDANTENFRTRNVGETHAGSCINGTRHQTHLQEPNKSTATTQSLGTSRHILPLIS